MGSTAIVCFGRPLYGLVAICLTQKLRNLDDLFPIPDDEDKVGETR